MGTKDGATRKKKAVDPDEVVEKPVALLRPLPGSTEEDARLLDGAVAQINRIYAQKTVETAQQVGEIVLNTFFGGDVANFRDRNRQHVTFRALAQREDMFCSYSFLYKAVAVADQVRALPEKVREGLPFTHQVMLLGVKDPDEKVRLANKALQGEVTSRQLAEEVREIRASQRNGSKVGRPSLPPWAKAFGTMKSVSKLLASGTISKEDFATIAPERADELLGDLEKQVADLQAAADQVRQAKEAWEAEVGR